MINWWTQDKGLFNHPTIPQKKSVYKDFHGKILQVPVLHKPPWHFVHYNSSDNKSFEVTGGRDDRILFLLSKKLNFRYNYSDPTERIQGSEVDNGAFSGVLGLIARREADLFIGDMGITYERSSAVEFTFITLADSGAFVTHAPSQLNEALALLRPFQWQNGTGIYGQLWEIMERRQNEYVVESVEEGVKMVKDKLDVAVMAGRETLFFDIQRFGPKNFHLSEKLNTAYSAIALQLGCPYVEEVNKILMAIFEAGIITKMTENEYENLGKQKESSIDETLENNVPTTKIETKRAAKVSEDNEKLKPILISDNKGVKMEQLLSELVKAIKGSRTAPDQVDLPLFNPDTTDAKKWLAEVGTIKTEFDWTDQQLLVRNLLKNLTDDSVPIRNLNLDRERVKSALDSNTKRDLRSNTKRRDTKVFQVGDFVLMHRDEKMHQGKLSYEFDGPFEVVGITPQQRYELRRVGKSTITKAAKEQLRIWPTDWSLTLDMPDLLELLEEEFRRVTFHLFVGYGYLAMLE
ncbi:unnamed protein product [Ceutorhynchus assimilis]|uniref:Ionotropic glutamate receptor L-glutamate and glycine-binding domain-containing protein n=1 Tax=Ceutorhynchus assimilis TaxID=467358 RepID=A0A9N9QKL3_9CUCU|nr:unnamed protein product [Ceutorhynchus assimilis]